MIGFFAKLGVAPLLTELSLRDYSSGPLTALVDVKVLLEFCSAGLFKNIHRGCCLNATMLCDGPCLLPQVRVALANVNNFLHLCMAIPVTGAVTVRPRMQRCMGTY